MKEKARDFVLFYLCGMLFTFLLCELARRIFGATGIVFVVVFYLVALLFILYRALFVVTKSFSLLDNDFYTYTDVLMKMADKEESMVKLNELKERIEKFSSRSYVFYFKATFSFKNYYEVYRMMADELGL